MKKLFRFIASLFRWLWRALSFVRQLLLNVLFIGVIVAVYFALTSETPLTPKKSDSAQVAQTEQAPHALLLNIDGPIVEQRQRLSPIDTLSRNALGQPIESENVLFDIVDTVRHAATDEQINGLVLSLGDMPSTSLTKLRYIAKAIDTFKDSGKPVIAIGGTYSQSQYYLASYADEVLMSPDGMVMLQGYGSYNLYWKDLLDKLDVTTHVFRVGTYKSFVEPYTRNNMSDPAREANQAWLSQIWDAYVSDVAENRGIEPNVLSPTAAQLLASLREFDGDFAALSEHVGIVDKRMTRQQIRRYLAEKFGSDGKDSFEYTGYYDYLPKIQNSFSLPGSNNIAVVVASGPIMDGLQRPGTVGGDTTAALLRDARLDDSVKAVVLRVDSPGGSAFASEVIRNEVDALREAGKPVVVSMSSVAASGGYWLSASADRIIAQPTTITGSIGIFSLFTTFENTLDDLGVQSDGVGTTPFAGVGLTRALPDDVGEIMQLGIEHGYHRFLSLVSNHRDMSMEEADTVAQGRVWTGQDALNLGLVDSLGDFDDAVSTAAELAGIDDYQLDWMQQPLTPFEQFINDMLGQSINVFGETVQANVPVIARQLAASPEWQSLTLLEKFNDPQGRYLFCLNCQYQ
ncbi:signal peptide peptidase SppA [Salinivibrio sp. ES.052]|uniref:signal peptide peptidase SppA n=1 Tax=Salinivibrio sp. ES.052 TaxID=1882823 RepID=UPI00092BCEBF|nr:signal peptide peptidase SppA [Salinivibrio sp. ES.052]SIN77444.1 signal peptide peptidase A. Serine peptidase. MEROPS family S49 [Salinivibrio sp. ES.052]